MFFSDHLTAALHVARVSGAATAPRLAELLQAAEDTCSAVLHDAVERGLMRHRPTGVMAGFSLTPAGKAAHAERVREELARCGFVHHLIAADTRFVELNAPFKELCTRWQLEGQPDDCIDALRPIHVRVTALLADLAVFDPRFGIYVDRLDSAIDRLRRGDSTALTKPLSGSYHDVWMELHQDLLATLCRERVASDGH